MALDKKYFDDLAEIISENEETLKAFVASALHKKTTTTNLIVHISAMLEQENCGLNGPSRLAVAIGVLESVLMDPVAMSEIMSAAAEGGGTGKEQELKGELDKFREKMKGTKESAMIDALKQNIRGTKPGAAPAEPVQAKDPKDLFKQERHPDQTALNDLLKKLVDKNKGSKKLVGQEIIDEIEVLIMNTTAEKGVTKELQKQLKGQTDAKRKEILTKFVKTVI